MKLVDKPDHEEDHDIALPQQLKERRGGYVVRRFGLGLPKRRCRPSGPPRLEYETRRRRHQPGIAGGGADQRREIHHVERPMDERAGDRGRGEQAEETRRAEPARDRRTEGDDPDGVQADMNPRTVHERVGKQRPYLCAALKLGEEFANEPRLTQRFRIDIGARQQVVDALGPKRQRQSRWNEGDLIDDRVIDLRQQKPQRMNGDERADEGDDDSGRVEYRLSGFSRRDRDFPRRIVGLHRKT